MAIAVPNATARTVLVGVGLIGVLSMGHGLLSMGHRFLSILARCKSFKLSAELNSPSPRLQLQVENENGN